MDTIAGADKDYFGKLLGREYERRIGKKINFRYSAIGWMERGKIIGTCVFFNYTGSNIDIHIEMPRLINRRTINDVYKYVFVQLKCNRLTAIVYSSNEKLLQLLPRMGWEYEWTARDYFGTPDKPYDAVVYKLTKNNAMKWIRG